MRVFKESLIFLFASLLVISFVVGDAVIGRSILAPVDIAPALWAKFGHIDPSSSGIPTNHHIVDQLNYDLPIQLSIHRSYQSGSIPWWDPYTLCGRPLLADAHANASDPIRVLLYLVVPNFVIAYNWTLILHHIVLGMGMFVLLRTLGSSLIISLPLALAFQFGGVFLIYFGHPWVTATFSWYPWLWIIWHSAWDKWARSKILVSALLCAVIIYSGNLQSHSYLPIFALCFAGGYSGKSMDRWKKAIRLVGVSGIAGGLLAAPVLGPELEVFLLYGGGRGNVITGGEPWHILLTFGAIWPWGLGTFRTVGFADRSFLLFAGVMVPILAVIGAKKPETETDLLASARRAACWSIIVSFAILCTPMFRFLYLRMAGIPLLGLVVLAALGGARLSTLPVNFALRLSRGIVAFALVCAVGAAILAYGVYPKVESKLREKMTNHAHTDVYLGRSLRLRNHQVDCFPSEIGFANPAIALGFTALIVGAITIRRRTNPSLLCLVNAIGPIFFASGHIPHPPTEQWERLLAGSDAQREIVSRIGEKRLQQGKPFERQSARLFPMQTAHLFKIHVFDGYTALGPDFYALSSTIIPSFASDLSVAESGEIEVTNTVGNSRIHWRDMPLEPVEIVDRGLNTAYVSFTRRTGGELLWTDTFYPGWRVTTNDGRTCNLKKKGVFSVIEVPSGANSVIAEYRPSHLTGLIGVSAVTGLGLCLCVFFRKRSSLA